MPRADDLFVRIILISASLKLLEPSGPVQACSGIALPLHEYDVLNGQNTWSFLCRHASHPGAWSIYFKNTDGHSLRSVLSTHSEKSNLFSMISKSNGLFMENVT